MRTYHRHKLTRIIMPARACRTRIERTEELRHKHNMQTTILNVSNHVFKDCFKSYVKFANLMKLSLSFIAMRLEAYIPPKDHHVRKHF